MTRVHSSLTHSALSDSIHYERISILTHQLLAAFNLMRRIRPIDVITGFYYSSEIKESALWRTKKLPVNLMRKIEHFKASTSFYCQSERKSSAHWRINKFPFHFSQEILRDLPWPQSLSEVLQTKSLKGRLTANHWHLQKESWPSVIATWTSMQSRPSPRSPSGMSFERNPRLLFLLNRTSQTSGKRSILLGLEHKMKSNSSTTGIPFSIPIEWHVLAKYSTHATDHHLIFVAEVSQHGSVTVQILQNSSFLKSQRTSRL